MSGKNCTTLVGIRQLQGSNANELEIRYFRTVKECAPSDEGNIYGICIENYIASCETHVLEESFEAYLTSNRDQADKILDKLIGNSVTAHTASEVIDFLYDDTLYVTE